MLFFTMLSIWPFIERHGHTGIILGISWAGLMWTRPDGFVYAAVLGLSFLLFCRKGKFWDSRVELLKVYIKAFIIGGLLYGPWFAWAWWYYGSPVPHTIIAKGLMANRFSFIDFTLSLIRFPVSALFDVSSLKLAFSPIYVGFGGWPTELCFFVSLLICWISSFLWIVPRISPLVRALSFATLWAHVYLTLIVKIVYPWYLPVSAILSLLTLVLAFHWSARFLERILCSTQKEKPPVGLYRIVKILGILVLLITISLFSFSAYELRIQQAIIENGIRRSIGEWLGNNAKTREDTVFLECLGYIGYFSQLEMLDYPGLSSPEVVDARRDLQTNRFDLLINKLNPNWLVLRPMEVARIQNQSPQLLKKRFHLAAVFDAGQIIQSYSMLPGRGYLNFDRKFYVFKIHTQ